MLKFNAVMRSCAMAMVLACGGVMGVAASPAAAQQTAPAADAPDTIIFKSGRVVQGRVLSETDTVVKFRVVMSGMSAEVEYQKSEILRIARGAASTDAPAAPAPASAPAATPAAATPPESDGVQAVRYAWVDLTGQFGVDITQTPIRQVFRDAKQNNVSTIVFMLDANWEANPIEPLPDDAANFTELMRAEPMTVVFANEVPQEWNPQPRIVFWVKTAMGGAAFLPMVCPEIYFHPEGKMGGIGNLSFLFEGRGDQVVREKQRSLLLGHAEGWARVGGYDYRIVRAMARVEAVLSISYEDGKPVLVERMPENPSEELLTWDGQAPNADSVRDRVRGEGKDVLTLNERTARLVGVSRGTAGTREEVLSLMGIDRSGELVAGRSQRIMQDWSQGVDSAKRQIRRLLQEFGEVYPQRNAGERDERIRQRGRCRKILEDIMGLLNRWGEGIDQRWRFQNNVPPEAQMKTIIEQLTIENMRDRR